MKFWRLDGALGASHGNLMDVLGSSTAPRPHPAAWPGRYSGLQSRLPAWLNITKFTRPAPPQHPQKPRILVRFSRGLRGSWAATAGRAPTWQRGSRLNLTTTVEHNLSVCTEYLMLRAKRRPHRVSRFLATSQMILTSDTTQYPSHA